MSGDAASNRGMAAQVSVRVSGSRETAQVYGLPCEAGPARVAVVFFSHVQIWAIGSTAGNTQALFTITPPAVNPALMPHRLSCTAGVAIFTGACRAAVCSLPGVLMVVGLSDGRLVLPCGADLCVYDVACVSVASHHQASDSKQAPSAAAKSKPPKTTAATALLSAAASAPPLLPVARLALGAAGDAVFASGEWSSVIYSGPFQVWACD